MRLASPSVGPRVLITPQSRPSLRHGAGPESPDRGALPRKCALSPPGCTCHSSKRPSNTTPRSSRLDNRNGAWNKVLLVGVPGRARLWMRVMHTGLHHPDPGSHTLQTRTAGNDFSHLPTHLEPSNYIDFRRISVWRPKCHPRHPLVSSRAEPAQVCITPATNQRCTCMCWSPVPIPH